MWNQWKSKLKLPEKGKFLVLLLIGLLLLVAAIPVNDDSDHQKINEQSNSYAFSTYEEKLEQRLENILENVDGVGKVEVMITLKSTSERVVEKDLQLDQRTADEEDSAGGSRMTKEQSSTNSSIFEEKADGSQTPYVSKEIMPEIEGVLIVAEGGSDPVIRQEITEAAQALFHLEVHKIKIMKGGIQ